MKTKVLGLRHGSEVHVCTYGFFGEAHRVELSIDCAGRGSSCIDLEPSEAAELAETLIAAAWAALAETAEEPK